MPQTCKAMNPLPHDLAVQRDVYLAESRYDNPKESFKFILNLMRPCLPEQPRILDVGCAAGEFAYLLRKTFAGCAVLGIDVIPELVDKARQQVPGCMFDVASALEPEGRFVAHFDAVVSIGVISTFSPVEVRTFLANLLRWARPGGSVFVFDKVNKHPLDVSLRYSYPGKTGDHFGCHVHSQESLRSLVREYASADAAFHSFEMPIDLLIRPDADRLRLWTFKDEHGRRIQINGWGLVQDQQCMVVRL